MFETVKLTKLNDRVYLMDDDGNGTGYIVIGSKKCAVIDTMYGSENLYDIVRTLTDLPVFVINTHGHLDHIFGNIYFEEVYINEKDMPTLKAHTSFPEFKELCEKMNKEMPELKFTKEGDTFDLGDLTLEIYDIPGHTPGGILVLCPELRILFTGDSINRHSWLQLPGCPSIKEWIPSLERVNFLKEKADYILHGHAKGFDPISLMDDHLQGAREIAEGKTENDPDYIWFGGTAKQHPFAPESVICYDPENQK